MNQAEKSLTHFRIIAETIKIEHTIFALPFALVAFFMTTQSASKLTDFFWVFVVMVSMRTFVMFSNRLIDRKIDGLNIRTANRPLVDGRLSLLSGQVYAVISVLIFLLAVSRLHTLAWFLSPVPIALAIIYPYLKRFTWLCHFGIGLIYLIVPPAVQIALTGDFSLWSVLLGIAAGLWVSGFDILYGIFDIQNDRRLGIHSIPARFGLPSALRITKILHFATIILIILTGYIYGFGLIYYIGVITTALLLTYENYILKPEDMSRLNTAFFTVNGLIAIIFFVFSVGDIFI